MNEKHFPPLFYPSNLKLPSEGTITIDVSNGIIAYLTRKCGGNMHNCGVVTITASSVDDPDTEAGLDFLSYNAADLSSRELFFPGMNPGNGPVMISKK
jgi:hypothetical protein